MKHNIAISGFAYKLRPVELSDASFIVDIRTKDKERTKYLHSISPNVSDQENWIKKYFKREEDYYFVIENSITGRKEGLIGIYDIDFKGKTAEWGRWVLCPESLGAIESVYLIYLVAFEKLELTSLYSRTIKNNEKVVSFHDSLGLNSRTTISNEFEINGKKYDAVKHLLDINAWKDRINPKIKKVAEMIYQKILKQEIEKLEFHHIGIATKDISKELEFWKNFGYSQEGEFFEDKLQGIRGVFASAKKQPRLELLENLPNSTTLDVWLAKGIRFYQFAYLTEDIEKTAKLYVSKFNAKLISPLKPASAFDSKRICFLIFSTGMIIELIERKKDE